MDSPRPWRTAAACARGGVVVGRAAQAGCRGCSAQSGVVVMPGQESLPGLALTQFAAWPSPWAVGVHRARGGLRGSPAAFASLLPGLPAHLAVSGTGAVVLKPGMASLGPGLLVLLARRGLVGTRDKAEGRGLGSGDGQVPEGMLEEGAGWPCEAGLALLA